MSIAVAQEALERDAKFWDEREEQLRDVAAAIGTLTLRRQDFSFAALGVADRYTTAVTTISQFVADGAASAGATAQVLRDVRDAWADHEAETASELRRTWIPRD